MGKHTIVPSTTQVRCKSILCHLYLKFWSLLDCVLAAQTHTCMSAVFSLPAPSSWHQANLWQKYKTKAQGLSSSSSSVLNWLPQLSLSCFGVHCWTEKSCNLQEFDFLHIVCFVIPSPGCCDMLSLKSLPGNFEHKQICGSLKADCCFFMIAFTTVGNHSWRQNWSITI